MAGAQDLEQVPHLVGGRKSCRLRRLGADARRLAALEGGDPAASPMAARKPAWSIKE